MSFINSLEATFQTNSNPENAIAMSKYMKNKFPFFGIKTPDRRQLLSVLWKENKQEIQSNPRKIARILFSKPEREFHYCAIEILIKELKNNFQEDDIHLIEELITTNSWWDSVDTISKYILGGYLSQFPQNITKIISKFSKSNNLWLNRSTILFQLGYKTKTDFELLKKICITHQNSKEFFIQKAIGWALREFAKTDSQAVKEFVLVNNLKPLSRKEALKNLPIA
ncbi:DNA alkylation repair protein [Flavobacterium sp. NG2]|uniref:DNA alkylation repair protein n=1 Tax=Flavobacterium sp. NG2 TaxID=3097547 RepID=UPI002A82DB2D|nr:DNA alkylation repair protein [Flavobacterium sp. NG2]WPR70631.1 DNA alkylation repair protein [Flavobacterium sp. NG2]